MSDTEDSQSFQSVRSRASREELSMTAHILATMEENGYIEAGTSDLLRAVSKLRLSDTLTDLTIVCGDRTWKTQKALACAHSGFFVLACKEGFKEGATSTVELHDEDEVLVEHILNYMYTLNWGPTTFVTTCDHESQEHSYKTKQCRLYPAKLCIAMHARAEKYDMQGLKKMCVARFQAAHHAKLKPEEQLELTKDVYENTREDDALRQIVRSCMINYIKLDIHLEGFRQFLLDTPEFAYDALKALSVWGDVNRFRHCCRCDRPKRVKVEIDRCQEGFDHEPRRSEAVHRNE